jgi:hypothetical protein
LDAEALGYEIRDAVEAGDLARAASLRTDLDRARFGASMAVGKPPAIPSGSLLNEIAGLDDGHVGELREGFLLGGRGSETLSAAIT